MLFNIINLFFIYQNMCLFSEVLTKDPYLNSFFLILPYSLLCFMSVQFYLFHVFFLFLFLFLVVSGKLKFYWPSSSHRHHCDGNFSFPSHPSPSMSSNHSAPIFYLLLARHSEQNKFCMKYG